MKKHLLLLISLVCLACTSDDSSSDFPRIEEVRGKVLGTAVCTTENNGYAYEIGIRNLTSVQKIITPNLPGEFKEEGSEIIFDMEQSQEGLSLCAAIYSPEVFYRVYHVRLVE